MSNLTINQKSISDFLSDFGKNSNNKKKLIIPDYQREYEWDDDNCSTLWSDLLTAFEEKRDTYFLGTIVAYDSTEEKGNIEIIDGQQRITSYMLLLRAIYNKLEIYNGKETVITKLKNRIEPCIWYLDELGDEVLDKNEHILETRIATDEYKQYFSEILSYGYSSNTNKKKNLDLYTNNFNLFCEKIEKFCSENTLDFEKFINFLLKSPMIFPIECDNQDTALSIFQTLNNRGLPLNDIDIFKAKIFKNTKIENRDNFIKNWKEILNETKNANTDLSFIFKEYMFVLRAEKQDEDIEQSLRKYFLENTKYFNSNGEYFLQDEKLLSNLQELINIWYAINHCYSEIDCENIYYNNMSIKTKQYLHVLKYYTNDYWKHAVSVFCYYNKDNKNFTKDFELFIEKLLAFLYYCYIYTKTSDTIKRPIYKIMTGIFNKTNINEIFENAIYRVNLDKNLLEDNINNSYNNKLTKGLLLLNSYLQTNRLIEDTFDVEHIFSQKWEKYYSAYYKKEIVNEFIEKLGNKIILESSINRRVKNWVFKAKRDDNGGYKNSKIQEVQILSEYNRDEWYIDDVDQRNKEIVDRIKNFLKINLY